MAHDEFHETPAPPAAPAGPHERGMGEGEMPVALSRFNWGAFMLPVFWGVAYGAWPMVFGWVLSMIVPITMLALLVPQGSAPTGNALIALTVVSEITGGILRLYSGSAANRLAWKREAIRLALLPDLPPRYSTQRFIQRQRKWIIIGVLLLAFALSGAMIVGLATGPEAEQIRADSGITQVDAAVSMVFLLAEVGLGLWLASKMKEEAPA